MQERLPQEQLRSSDHARRQHVPQEQVASAWQQLRQYSLLDYEDKRPDHLEEVLGELLLSPALDQMVRQM